jgi:hypothetical protein
MSTVKPDRRTKQSLTSNQRPSQTSTKPTEATQDNAAPVVPQKKRMISNQLPSEKPPKTRTNRTTPNLDAEENPAFENNSNAIAASQDTRATKNSMNRIGDGKPKNLSRKPTEMSYDERKDMDIQESEISETDRRSDGPIYQGDKAQQQIQAPSQQETVPVIVNTEQEPTDKILL